MLDVWYNICELEREGDKPPRPHSHPGGEGYEPNNPLKADLLVRNPHEIARGGYIEKHCVAYVEKHSYIVFMGIKFPHIC